jgi:hypothetical protein
MNTPTLLEIESEIPIYGTRRRCFIRPYGFVFSFVYGNFCPEIPVINGNLVSKLVKDSSRI